MAALPVRAQRNNVAREAALSRSVLAQRFTELVGDTPMHYLASWRMQLAKQMMREGTHNIQEVAARVGYDSEARSIGPSNARLVLHRRPGARAPRCRLRTALIPDS
jgi:transcriptional regulator GlxA family with amidase domain